MRGDQNKKFEELILLYVCLYYMPVFLLLMIRQYKHSQPTSACGVHRATCFYDIMDKSGSFSFKWFFSAFLKLVKNLFVCKYACYSPDIGMQSCFILSQNEKSANIEYIIIVINDTLEQSFCGLLYIRRSVPRTSIHV